MNTRHFSNKLSSHNESGGGGIRATKSMVLRKLLAQPQLAKPKKTDGAKFEMDRQRAVAGSAIDSDEHTRAVANM